MEKVPSRYPGWLTYTIDSSVAARDATPAMTVVAASNFCPVPPVMLMGGWDNGPETLSKSRHQWTARRMSFEDDAPEIGDG